MNLFGSYFNRPTVDYFITFGGEDISINSFEFQAQKQFS